jgi:hypothetical protein
MKETISNMDSFIATILMADQELAEKLNTFGLADDETKKNKLLSSLATLLLTSSSLKTAMKNGWSSYKIYEEEYKKVVENVAYAYSGIFFDMQTLIYSVFTINIDWFSPINKYLYVQFLVSFRYGNLNNFFYENRKKFLPEYDWFIIEKDFQRKQHIEAFFKEYDKFSKVIESISNYVDIDLIPADYMAYLSSILGIKMITEQEITTHDQIRSVISNIAEVYKAKGSLYAFELFLASLGVSVKINEMYFDRRLYWFSKNPDVVKNPYTKSTDANKFEYYLTPKNPIITFYQVAPTEKPMLLATPQSASQFKKLVNDYITNSNGSIESVLGYDQAYIDREHLTYFKTNVVIIDFGFFYSEEDLVSLKYQKLLEKYMEVIIPVYVRKYYPESVFEETYFEDHLIYLFPGGSGFKSVLAEDGRIIRVENSDMRAIHYFNQSGGTDDLSSSLEIEDKDGNELFHLLDVDGFGKTDEANIPFSITEASKKETFETEKININEDFSFIWSPTIELGIGSTINSGSISIEDNLGYGNDLLKIYSFDTEETIEIEIT